MPTMTVYMRTIGIDTERSPSVAIRVEASSDMPGEAIAAACAAIAEIAVELNSGVAPFRPSAPVREAGTSQ
ncbi:hypothetical protein [Burkholderia gladioli]|uniref:hypothetical protein n=1 Tax=Burkholderia gladioli TaxID=28095 RepID=UPI00163E8A27|nr:hypothetical protein [Burkholderia gladioli]